MTYSPSLSHSAAAGLQLQPLGLPLNAHQQCALRRLAGDACQVCELLPGPSSSILLPQEGRLVKLLKQILTHLPSPPGIMVLSTHLHNFVTVIDFLNSTCQATCVIFSGEGSVTRHLLGSHFSPVCPLLWVTPHHSSYSRLLT